MAASRLRGGDTTVPVLARGKVNIGRLWVYVRDDRPFASADPPAAVFHYLGDRRGEHPRAHLDGGTCILQADAYAGYDQLYAPGRLPVPLVEACFAHARWELFELADVEGAARHPAKGRESPVYPVAVEAMHCIDALEAAKRGLARMLTQQPGRSLLIARPERMAADRGRRSKVAAPLSIRNRPSGPCPAA